MLTSRKLTPRVSHHHGKTIQWEKKAPIMGELMANRSGVANR